MSGYERGEYSPSPEIVEKMASTYGVTKEVLLAEATEGEKSPRIEDDETLLAEAELALRNESGELLPEDVEEIKNFIEFKRQKRQRQRGEDE